jgi:hypothetical protein
MKAKFLFACILLPACLAPGLRAQDTEFWFAAPHMSTMSYSTPLNYPAFLAISNATYQEAQVVITLYNGGTTRTITAAVPSQGLYKYDFDASNITTIENPRASAGNVVKFGTHIVSDVRVTAYYMMNGADSRDIFTLKGKQALGKKFYAPMQHDNAAKSSGTFQGLDQIDIVATEDNTTVTIVPKAKIRLGGLRENNTGTESPAGTPITRTLNRGETLKIIEYNYDESPSLAGTEITSDKDIAVTVTEDLVAGDTSGDQIVPVNSLGTHYIVAKGYRSNSPTDRIYLVGTESSTTVKIYATASSTSPTKTITLTAGQTDRYDFPSSSNAIYVEATNPVYVYHRSGLGEEGAAVLPSAYSIGQTLLSFYQVSAAVQRGFLVFRTGAESGFSIKYGTGAFSTLSLTPLSIPNVPEWKVARFDYAGSVPTAGRAVTIQSTKSAFALGYITGNTANNDSYGYFSAFGEFRFASGDITWMCGSSVVLEGGYAKSYKWTLLDGSIIEGPSSITATQEGLYTLEMDQDPNTVTASTTVQKVNAGSIAGGQVICKGWTPAKLTVGGATEPPDTQYQWQQSLDNATWTDITGATSTDYQPGALTQTTWYRRGMT